MTYRISYRPKAVQTWTNQILTAFLWPTWARMRREEQLEMGYTTDFEGEFDLDRPLDDEKGNWK